MYVCGRVGHRPRTNPMNPLNFDWIWLKIGWKFYKNRKVLGVAEINEKNVWLHSVSLYYVNH